MTTPFLFDMTVNHLRTGQLSVIIKWRKCMGIEPTWDATNAPHRI
jgi:hypothetical protein